MFDSLPAEKRERILNAAMAEFAAKGYSQASTNEIVKQAGISKGLLFHYFGNKKSLFLSLYDYAIEFSIEEFFSKADMDEPDLFERLRLSEKVKIDMLKRYPALFAFLQKAYMEQEAEVQPEVEKRNVRYISSSMSKLFQGIDVTLFRENLDIQKSLKVLFWVFDGMGNEFQKQADLLHRPTDFDQAFQQVDEYLNFLKALFYH
jgi:AcrR family transcriptional regulator